MTVVSSLWIGETLSPLVRACVQSFINKGYDFHLYCYRPVRGVPAACTLRDATEVLPESSIIRYTRGPGKGSVALFANMFRYKLLHQLGGWWVDMDMFCLADALPDAGIVLAREDEAGINNAIMRFPAGHAALLRGFEECARRGEDADWGDTGPRLLTELAAQYQLGRFAFPAAAFHPIHYRHFWMIFDPRRTAALAALIGKSACVHLWNNMLSRSTLDLAVLPPDGSLLRNMYEWTLGLGDFTHEYVLQSDSPPDELSMSVVPR